MKKYTFLLLPALAVLCLTGCGEAAQTKEYIKELPKFSSGEYPESFDLRDYGYVTSVKSQGELGYCWAFASIAAAETSILSESGTSINENALDLSEHHLAWFAKNHIPGEGEEGYDAGNPQSGEGFYTGRWGGSSWSDGADPMSAVCMFAAGIGVVSEETAPYQGKNGTIKASDDWTLPEELRFSKSYDLEAAYCLPALAATGGSLNTEAIAALKEMLLQGKAAAVSYAYSGYEGENANSSQNSSYLNEKTYAHYTYEEMTTDHCITIVGWDDNYSSENFNAENQPAGNGAWICKNSWGAKTEKKPNKSNWGVDGSGYFYISYYDQSLTAPVVFDFDTDADHTNEITQQYDFMGCYGIAESSSEKIMTANVFTAESDMKLTAVGTMSPVSDTEISFAVYLLEEGFETPEDGTPAGELCMDGKYEGYYRGTLDAPVEIKKGQKYAVVVTLKGKDAGYYYQFNQTAQSQDSLIAMFTGNYDVAVVNPGESFIFFEEEGWEDYSEYLVKRAKAEEMDTLEVDNFSIKAFGK